MIGWYVSERAGVFEIFFFFGEKEFLTYYYYIERMYTKSREREIQGRASAGIIYK